MVSSLTPYFELAKPRIVTMVLVTTAIGYFFGSHGHVYWPVFLITLFGTGLSCAGAATLNHCLEIESDRLMKRTSRRPLPAGEVSPLNALGYGTTLVLAGTLILVVEVNLLTGFLALLTAFLYVLVYTPLKRVTWLNTFIGAIPGALPPMGGWAAACGSLELGAWILFLILFIWQHPHFYSIAWMYREDYARGGLKMLPVVEPDGKSTFERVIVYSVLLIPVSLVPTFIGMSGQLYLWGTLIMGIGMLWVGIRLAQTGSMTAARNLLKASVFYLPVWLILILVDARL